MSKRIEFPLDSSDYLRKARLLLQEGKSENALALMEKAYTSDDDVQINIFYALMLVRFEMYEEALDVMNQEKSLYMNNEKYASFYAETLIMTQKFIEAEYIIQKYTQDQAIVDPQAWANLGQKLVEERERIDLEVRIQRNEIKKSLRELEQYSHLVQLNKIKQAEKLDLSDLQKVAPIILVSPNISGIVQRYLLELLIQEGDQQTYSFMWFNQLKKVCPAELPRFDDIEIVHEILKMIEEKLAKYPDLAIRVQIELTNDLLLLYPYIEETIKDIDFWVNAYISALDFFGYMDIEQPAITTEQQEMMQWIDYLNTIAQRDEMFSD